MTRQRLMLAVLGLLIGGGTVFATTAYAQTSGMERRGERRDDRDGAREEKAECKSGDEKTRPECRQDKRDAKREGRGNEDKPEQTEGT